VFNSRIAPTFCRWRKLHACCKTRKSTLGMLSTTVLHNVPVVNILAALSTCVWVILSMHAALCGLWFTQVMQCAWFTLCTNWHCMHIKIA
jgi:hypothetical protein